MKEKLRYCIEYINPRFPLLSSGNLNIRHLRVEQKDCAETAIDLILSFGGKIISTYRGSVTRGRVADWDAKLELEDKFSQEWLDAIKAEKKTIIEQEAQTRKKYEYPSKVIESITVTSRMKYIKPELKPIADFLLDYAYWDLDMDRWNHPVAVVPVSRVLDAIAQEGKPYCCKG